MKQIGVVESVSGSEANVRVKRVSACGCNCAGCGGSCNAGDIMIIAENKAGAGTGDRVELEMPSSKALSAAVWVYVIPLVFFVIGYMLSMSILHSEPMSLLGGFAVMGAVYTAVILMNKKNKEKYRVVVEKIL